MLGSKTVYKIHTENRRTQEVLKEGIHKDILGKGQAKEVGIESLALQWLQVV